MKRLITTLLIAPLTFVGPAVADDMNTDNMKLEELPKAAQETVKREVKAGKITEIEREDAQGRMYFEVEFVQNNQKYEIHVAEDGKLISRKTD